MQLKKNELEIIQLLLASDDYISSYKIATSIGISRRKVRDEMRSVKNILKSLHLNLSSKTSQGYYIENKSSQDLTELQNIINNNARSSENLIPILPDERINYISSRLINSKDYIKLEQLADELLVSRSTIVNDLTFIKKDFKKFGLKFNQKPNYGIYISGPEASKRKCLVSYIFENLNVSNMFYSFLDAYFKSPDYKLIEIIRKYHIVISDISLIDFLIGFSISTARIQFGYSLSDEIKDFEEFEKSNEYLAAKELATYVKDNLNIEFNKYEIQNITIQLICKKSVDELPCNDPYIIKIAQEVLDEIKKQTLIDFSNEDFYKTFFSYIKYTLIRQKYDERIRTPLYLNIQYAYPLAYYLAKITSDIIQKHTNIAFSRSELTNYTILFNNTINNRKLNQKKVLLINCMNKSTQYFIKDTIEKELNEQIKITKSIPYYEIEEQDLSQYDFILSTITIHRQLPIPVISINYLMSQEDIFRIKSYLSHYYNDDQILYYFHPDFYETHVGVKTKSLSNIFYQSIKKIFPLNHSKKNSIISKNNCSIHTFENQIGLLKLARPLNSNNIISIAVLEEPITIEKQTFKIAILFSCNDNQNIMYNTLFTILKNLSQNKQELDKLLSHISYTEFLSILLKNK